MVCPVCTIGTAVGIGIARYTGIDDTITGLWIGGLLFSISLWFKSYTDKRGWKNYIWILFTLFIYLLTLFPLYISGIVGEEFNKIFGIDRLLFGIGNGTIFFFFSILLHNYLKRRNNGKPYFMFQKVVIPISFLLILSLLFNITIAW